jgi:hypothetical protein
MRASIAAIFVLLSLGGGCEFERDSVGQGYYGPVQAGTRASGVAGTSSPPMAAGGSPAVSAGRIAPAPPPAPPPMAAAGAGAAGRPAIAAGPCDLSGRWLSTEHFVTDALGQLQYAHTYYYYEIAQQGSAFKVSKGLQCGNDAVGEGDLAVTVSFRASWPASMQKIVLQGRTGSSMPAAVGCDVSFEKWYTVQGATLPHYLDPATTLPTVEQQAAGSTPGWEDWDNDGNPGVTGLLTGAISGKVFVAPRNWTSMTGNVPDVTNLFSLPLQWESEKNLIGYDGSPLLVSDAVRAADPQLHFTELARLSDNEATGDDASICARVVELAPTLTARAAGL